MIWGEANSARSPKNDNTVIKWVTSDSYDEGCM